MSQRVKRQIAGPQQVRVTSYWERTQWPLQSLYFLLPLLIVYEVGAVALAPEGNARLPPIIAERMLGQAFAWLGWYGYYLPGLATVLALLGIHLVRRDPWRPEPLLCGAMAVESAALALPLFVFSVMLSRGPAEAAAGFEPLAMLAGGAGAGSGGATGFEAVGSWPAGAVFSIGAGIYEELVFRLLGIVLVHTLLADLLGVKHKPAAAAAVAVSAVAFALYHPFDGYNPLRWSSREVGHFVFYTLAGLYFAAIYVYRGFGIVAATHAIYDVLVISLYFSRAG